MGCLDSAGAPGSSRGRHQPLASAGISQGSIDGRVKERGALAVPREPTPSQDFDFVDDAVRVARVVGVAGSVRVMGLVQCSQFWRPDWAFLIRGVVAKSVVGLLGGRLGGDGRNPYPTCPTWSPLKASEAGPAGQVGTVGWQQCGCGWQEVQAFGRTLGRGGLLSVKSRSSAERRWRTATGNRQPPSWCSGIRKAPRGPAAPQGWPSDRPSGRSPASFRRPAQQVGVGPRPGNGAETRLCGRWQV